MAAFLLLGTMMSSLLEPLVTHLLQHVIHSSGRVLGWRGRGREQGKRPRQGPPHGVQEGKNVDALGEARPTL